MKKIIFVTLVTVIGIAFSACTDLDEKLYSDVDASQYYKTKSELDAALTGIYGTMMTDRQYGFAPGGDRSIAYLAGLTTDEWFLHPDWGGTSAGSAAGQLRLFLFNPSNASATNLRQMYAHFYAMISQANQMLDNIPGSEVSQNEKDLYTAEVRALRAHFYYVLWTFFGNICIKETSEVLLSTMPEQKTSEQVVVWIEKELLEVIPILADVNYIGTANYGRMHKAGAQAVLAKLYLNSKQWEKCANICTAIIGNAKFGLAEDYQNIFAVDNHLADAAKEMLVVMSCIAQDGRGNIWLAEAMPGNWPGFNGWGGYFGYRAFYEEFDPDDIRRERMIVDSYVNNKGVVVTIPHERFFPQKYELDLKTPSVSNTANDIPVIRMGDIYLAKAEALNQLNGPNQESIDLINSIRDRAFPEGKKQPCQLSQFADKNALNDYILQERHFELWCEHGFRREDLIRHDKFISTAQSNLAGVNAKPFHVLFPFPQVEIDRNKNMKQNLGYE